MSVLSDLEKQLGLPSFNSSILQCSDEHIYDGVDFSTPSASCKTEERIQKKAEKLVERMGKPDLVGVPAPKPWLSTNNFDPAIIAGRMGIPTTNISSLYLHVLDLYKRTEQKDVKDLCEDILKHLYYNEGSRDEINGLINKLNRVVR